MMFTPLQVGLGALVGWILAHPELGWIVAIIYLVIEIRTPWGKIKELTDLIKNVVTVVRALARVHNDIDTEGVDEYLLENGMDPQDFISDDGDEKAEQSVFQQGGDD